jgi:phenylalanyl-tRNA synthetase beta chain
MRVPIEWLKEFVDFTVDARDLALKLTMAGLEVEGMETILGDAVLEINVTPNRPDCLSILGVAREVAALLNRPLRFPDFAVVEEGGTLVRVEIADEELCHRYAGREIKGLRIADSPDAIKKRLEKCGMRPINNVVDITNYVLLELGHPLHAFDMDRLKGSRIRVERSVPGSKITTLDGTERLLPDDALLISDAERPVAVAGVMGGSDSEVTESTRNVFLESAYFLPSSVRRTSKALGLKTESSYRFERGTDIEMLEKALDRAAFLMEKLAGGRISKKEDVYPRPYRKSTIKVRYGRVNKILGTSIPDDEMVDIAQRLGLEPKGDASFFSVSAPSFRTDLQREIDIIEEIARFYGYEKIQVTVPKTPVAAEGRDEFHRVVSIMRGSFRASGFSEAINYSFMNNRMLDLLNIGNEDRRSQTVRLRNPLNEEESRLRTTLVPSLIQNLVYNLSMGTKEVRLFESSRVFISRGDTLPEERHNLGAISFREKGPSLWKEGAPDFYVVKGLVESIMTELKITDYAFGRSSEPFLHPGKACDVTVSGRRMGFLGDLHPEIVGALGLKISRPEIIVAEIYIDDLVPLVTTVRSYTSLPRYPFIERDIALIVDDGLPAADVVALIRNYPSGLIEDVSIFDCYRGKNIPDGKKSLAFTVRYRAKDRTLTDSEIEELHGKLLDRITGQTAGIIRGT